MTGVQVECEKDTDRLLVNRDIQADEMSTSRQGGMIRMRYLRQEKGGGGKTQTAGQVGWVKRDVLISFE